MRVSDTEGPCTSSRARQVEVPLRYDAILRVASSVRPSFRAVHLERQPQQAWRTLSQVFSEPPWRLLIPPIDKRSAKSFIRTNERIRAREVRVIDENGEQLGVMVPFEALKMARERSLDLVEISPNAVPPVCKIQDYGKFLYEKDKSDRAARKRQKIIVIKEVKFSVTVDEHDYQTKKDRAVRFLGEGDKVKASLRFKGRQMAHRDLGYKIINRLILDIGDAGTVEFMPRMEGTTLHAILAPLKKAEVQQPSAPKKVATVAAPQAVAPETAETVSAAE